MKILNTLLVLVVLTGTALCSPTCDPKCELTYEYHHPDLKHVSELGSSSVAPWELSIDTKAGREPEIIEYAQCKGCTEKNMTAKAIVVEVSVYEMARSGSGKVWCKCPFDLAVGCTCVKKR